MRIRYWNGFFVKTIRNPRKGVQILSPNQKSEDLLDFLDPSVQSFASPLYQVPHPPEDWPIAQLLQKRIFNCHASSSRNSTHSKSLLYFCPNLLPWRQMTQSIGQKWQQLTFQSACPRVSGSIRTVGC